MDLGTHMLIGYMIAWTAAFTFTGYHEYLILLAVVMAMIPDFDFFLIAIPRRFRKRFRALGHRGATHSIIFILGCAIVVSYIFSVVYKIDLVLGIILASIAGLSHTFIDSLTSFPFPSLAPFSWKDRSFNLDGAVTWYMIPFGIFSLSAMWWMRVYNVPFGTYELFVGLVFALLFAHYLARLSVKLYVERVLYRGQRARVNPTYTLLKFYVVVKKNIRGINIIEYMLMRLPRSRVQPDRRYFELDRLDGEEIFNPGDVYEAVLSSSRALRPKRIGELSNVAAAHIPSEDEGALWKIFWFDWNDWNPVRGTPGTIVTVGPDGRLSEQMATRRISW
jgi:membrane-bound metal-dependent hydrolase YbcI (DUF457 family)